MDDTSPLGKSVEEIERESGNLDPDHTSHQEGRLHGGVIIPPTGLGGVGGTATGTGTGFPLMPTGHRGGGGGGGSGDTSGSGGDETPT